MNIRMIVIPLIGLKPDRVSEAVLLSILRDVVKTLGYSNLMAVLEEKETGDENVRKLEE